MIRKTSIEAFKIIMESDIVGPFQKDVYEIIYNTGPTTPGEVAMEYQKKYPGTHRGRNEIAKRFYELTKAGIIEETGIERPCRATGFTVLECDVNGLTPIKPENEKKDLVCVIDPSTQTVLVFPSTEAAEDYKIKKGMFLKIYKARIMKCKK